MYSARLIFLTLFAAPLLVAQSANPADPDGLTILQTMSRHYANARSWYIAATEERTSWNDYNRNWAKTVMMGAVSGNRYRFEGHGQLGSALHVSDGKTAWDFHPEEHAYVQKPAPANGYQPPTHWFMNEGAAQRAAEFLKEFSDLASHCSEATRLPDETLTLDEKPVSCYVVRVSSEQRKGPHTANFSSEETLWIDKATLMVQKRVVREHSYMMVTAEIHVPIEANTVTTYSAAVLDGPVPESLFRFEPPQDAQLVANFSDNLSFAPDLTGKPAPDVQLVGADGKRASLSSYRGKPVLLDFWATWCAPCTESMPKLAELQKDAGMKGLVLLSIDEDDDVKKADDYLAQHHYAWPNTQDDGKIGDAFSKMGIPLYVLIDAQGKIVFYGSGTTGPQETALRKAVAALGPEFASLAPSEKPQPCERVARQ